MNYGSHFWNDETRSALASLIRQDKSSNRTTNTQNDSVLPIPSQTRHLGVQQNSQFHSVNPSNSTLKLPPNLPHSTQSNLRPLIQSSTTQSNMTDNKIAPEPNIAPIELFYQRIVTGIEIPPPPPQDSKTVVLTPLLAKQRKCPIGGWRALSDNDSWHRFTIISAGSYDREKVLKKVLDACEPHCLIPVLCHAVGEDLNFFARQCWGPINKLYNNFQLLDIDGVQLPIYTHLHYAAFSKFRISAMTILHQALEKRWNAKEKSLDLTDFFHDLDVQKYLYCPLSQPATLQSILQIALNYQLHFHVLRLNKNRLTSLKMDALARVNHFKTLDLRDNEIPHKNELWHLKDHSKITSLLLDGNPICEEFSTVDEYINFVKSVLPQLQSLDNVSVIGPTPQIQNFLCSLEPEDGYHLVNQFIKHFFNRFDWSDRRASLDGIYHPNAIFSLTSSCEIPADLSKLHVYFKYSRNLKKISDYSKADSLIHIGPASILDMLSKLPRTEHDPYSFCVDLMNYNSDLAMVSVTGVFREALDAKSLPLINSMRSFHRVFVLSCTGKNEWQIKNEQLHVSNVTPEQAETSFLYERLPIESPVTPAKQDAQTLNNNEKAQMIDVMVQLSQLKPEWAQKILEDNDWFMQDALADFVNRLESESIQQDAFNKM